ncbi:helix-turn-helix transcriptional regulator [Burkholderia sp. BCC1970]|uniref:helix-turn-helix domain-containing protein n=1 Tax=Burkholderia sp. BCC1970 TaxID=2817437 RepID=UPI002ABD2D76|nr:helix-turn-helix transcriptional regulator [Burkholderia sp. BCC1970]
MMLGLCMSGLARTFAEQVRLRREAAKLSQEQLGDLVGLDRTAVSRIERVHPNLTISRVASIAQALGVEISQLLEGGGADDATPAAGVGETTPTVGPLETTPKSSQQDGIENLLQRIQRNIKLYRERAGLTQRQVAERLDTDRNWVSTIEAGRANITLKTIEKFAAALETTPVELLAKVAEDLDNRT